MEIKRSISQIKNTVENLSSRLDQIESRVLGLEDKVNVLKQKDGENKLSTNRACKTSGTLLKDQIYESLA
jgi:hypothetical protein